MSDPTAHRPDTPDLEQLARDVGIPACPAILAQFSAEMNQDEPDMRRLADLIATDAALSASLLKLVNSPFYGLRTPANSLQQALSVIGLRAAAQLVTGLILRQVFAPEGSAAMARYWEQSAALAATAVSLARQLRGIDADEAHTYALFRDCGMLVMLKKFGDYTSLMDQMPHLPGTQIIAQEQSRYRYSHARVGYALARGWLLPEPFCLAILFHHAPDTLAQGRRETDGTNRKLAAFGLLVEQVVALKQGEGLCPDWPQGESFVLETLGISPDEIVTLIQATDIGNA